MTPEAARAAVLWLAAIVVAVVTTAYVARARLPRKWGRVRVVASTWILAPACRQSATTAGLHAW